MCAPPAILPESVKLPTHCEDKSPFLFLFLRHIALVLIEVQLLAACYKAFTSLASELAGVTVIPTENFADVKPG